MRTPDYVLVTPVKDEQAHIRKTIRSVISQSHQPAEWVIVSDGSTDGTDALVSEAAAAHPWIKLLALPPREGRCFGHLVGNVELGISRIESTDYEFIGLLDADVSFGPEYYAEQIRLCRENPSLGLVGGVVIDVGQPRDRIPRNLQDVPGAVQFFRKSCFDSLGGLIAVPEGGWDGLTCAVSRMNGFETKLLTHLVVDHHKPRNSSQGGALNRKWQMGLRDRAMGYDPIFEFAKCASRIREAPAILGAAAWYCGFVTASLRRRPRVVPPAVVNFIRQEQRRRIMPWFSRTTTTVQIP
jgi:poly-beta-1,6-N-acetyl-D-glucosamine synthase